MLARVVCFVLIGVATFGAPVFSQVSEIVDTDEVAQALERGAIVWDVRDAAAYQAGHLPGAVNLGAITAVLRDPSKEDWLPTPQIETLLGEAGIDFINQDVIVYAQAGDPAAYFGLLTMRYFGSQRGKVYHGGIDAWKASGKPIATEPTARDPVALKLQPQPKVVVWTDELLQKFPEVQAGEVQLVDVRLPTEYSGKVISAIRGGHIPGAVNIPVGQNLTDPPAPAEIARGATIAPERMALKPREELKALYAQLDPHKETIVHCQSGVRAAETATVLRALGFKNVTVYEPSWLGYASVLSAPVDDEVFVNIGALNSQLRALQARIDALEKELTELRPEK